RPRRRLKTPHPGGVPCRTPLHDGEAGNDTEAHMAEHRNINRWREMRDAFFRGDIEPALALYDPAIVWTNDEAAGPIAGTHHGVDAVLAMLGKGMELFQGTLTQ